MDSGFTWSAPFAHYDPVSSSWRTSQLSLFEGSTSSSVIWPPSGMTRSGAAFELLTSGPPTSGGECSSPPTLPTPRTSDTNGAGTHGQGGPDLRTAVSLLPTPAVNDMGEGKTVDWWDQWTEKMRSAHGNGNGHGKSLAIEALRLLPTPTATDNGTRTTEGVLRRFDQGHQTDVWMALTAARHPTSVPTPQPSPDGPPSWDETPLPLPSTDD